MIDRSERVSRFLRDIYHTKVGSRVWLHIVLALVLLDATVSAQNDPKGDTDKDPSAEETRSEPPSATPKADETVSPQGEALDQAEAKRADLTLSEFLLAVRPLGAFFSFGLWTGLFAELELEFKLHDHGYLSLLSSCNGGYQFDLQRSDFLFSETLGYRRYFAHSAVGAWTVFGGASFGYFTTTEGESERGYDWLHLGLKAKGGYYFFTGKSLAVGIDVGMSLAYQLSEFIGADNFLVFVPDLSATLLF